MAIRLATVQDVPETAQALAKMLLDYAAKNKATRQKPPQKRRSRAARSASL